MEQPMAAGVLAHVSTSESPPVMNVIMNDNGRACHSTATLSIPV